MNEILSYLSDLDLLNPMKIAIFVGKCSEKELEKFVSDLRSIVSNNFKVREYSPFSFVPSGNLSGAGGCCHTKCRIKRASKLASFSAMYADTMYISLDTISDPCFFLDFDKDSRQIKEIVINDLNVINVYKDLINAGIVIITPSNGTLCENCFRKYALHLDDHIDLRSIASYYSKNVEIKISFYIKTEKLYLIKIIDHNGVKVFEDSFFTISADSVPIEDIKDNNIVGQCKDTFLFKLFRSNFYHVQYNIVTSTLNHSKYLLDNECDGNLIETANKESVTINRIENNPIFNMPVINNTNVLNILHLREKENRAFENYRIAIQNAIVEQKNSGGQSAQLVYDKNIYPALNALNFSINKIRTDPIKSAITEFGVMGSIICVGVITGLIPQNIAQITEEIGGLGVVKHFADSIIGNILEDRKEFKNNDYYFLWKLNSKNRKKQKKKAE